MACSTALRLHVMRLHAMRLHVMRLHVMRLHVKRFHVMRLHAMRLRAMRLHVMRLHVMDCTSWDCAPWDCTSNCSPDVNGLAWLLWHICTYALKHWNKNNGFSVSAIKFLVLFRRLYVGTCTPCAPSHVLQLQSLANVVWPPAWCGCLTYGSSLTMNRNNCKYHWCDNHGRWSSTTRAPRELAVATSLARSRCPSSVGSWLQPRWIVLGELLWRKYGCRCGCGFRCEWGGGCEEEVRQWLSPFLQTCACMMWWCAFAIIKRGVRAFLNGPQMI